MKTLLIVRHAKSSWDSADISDIDRPLNDRGKRDAPAMAHRLIKAGVAIDRFVSSPAKRARTTAGYFAHAYGRKDKEIRQVPDLYHADILIFKQVVTALDDDDKTVAIFSHNPGITAFANAITDVSLDNMPTCAVFAVRNEVGHWKDFFSGDAKFWFFDYPKAGGHD